MKNETATSIRDAAKAIIQAITDSDNTWRVLAEFSRQLYSEAENNYLDADDTLQYLVEELNEYRLYMRQ